MRRATFEARAAVYDRLRPQDEAWWTRFERLVALGDLQGRRVLDVGCGTGSLLEALRDRAGAEVVGAEPSDAMRAAARERLGGSVDLVAAAAENLPFGDETFERVVFCFSIHLVERAAALAEARRILEPGGRIAIATFPQAHFPRYWAAPFFPSLAAIDCARFPDLDALAAELVGAGFEAPETETWSTTTTISRDDALARLHGRHISTFDLLDPDEVDAGIARAERELPGTVATELLQSVCVASRPR